MEFSRAQTRRLAKLARLALDDEQVDAYRADLGAILGYVAKLDELDVEGVEPTTHAVELAMILREDAAARVFSHDDVMQNAPDTHDGMFRVPKVVSE